MDAPATTATTAQRYALYERAERPRDDGSIRLVYFRLSAPYDDLAAACAGHTAQTNRRERLVVAPWPFDEDGIVPPGEVERLATEELRRRAVEWGHQAGFAGVRP